MKYIIDFYKELDAVNLIVFWGTLIVVILLLTFSIILANKNKKLKYIIESKGIDIDNYDFDEELAIKKDVETDNNKITNQSESIIKETNKDIQVPKQEWHEGKFTPEELVMEYNKNETVKNTTDYYKKENDISTTTNKELSNKAYNNEYIQYRKPIINNVTNIVLEKETEVSKPPVTESNLYQNKTYNNNKYQSSNNIGVNNNVTEKKNESSRPITNEPNIYEKNTINKTTLNQTSPIGIVKKEDNNIRIINNARELHENLHYEDINEKKLSIPQVNSIQRQREIAEEVRKQEKREEKPRGNYLEEISKSLSKITNEEGLNRTEYELKQEEDAIISYKELMEKKDSIETVDEEEAIISMEELIARKQKEEKLYNITNDAENDKFINELKNFRSDL